MKFFIFKFLCIFSLSLLITPIRGKPFDGSGNNLGDSLNITQVASSTREWLKILSKFYLRKLKIL